MINKDELLFVVNNVNTPIEPKTRSEVHKKGYWHRVAHIWIMNEQNNILCQQRSKLKDTFPGFWEGFFGGHLPPHTDYLDGALVEIKEELGLNFNKEELQLFTIYKSYHAKEFQAVYLIRWSGNEKQLHFEKEEIEKLQWFPFEQLREILLIEKKSDWTKMEYTKLLFNWLEDKKKW